MHDLDCLQLDGERVLHASSSPLSGAPPPVAPQVFVLPSKAQDACARQSLPDSPAHTLPVVAGASSLNAGSAPPPSHDLVAFTKVHALSARQSDGPSVLQSARRALMWNGWFNLKGFGGKGSMKKNCKPISP